MSNDKLKTPEDLRHSTGVMTEQHAHDESLLKDLFEGFETASRKEKAFVNTSFTTPEGQRRPPHSALLQKTASELRSSPSLKNKVRDILGE